MPLTGVPYRDRLRISPRVTGETKSRGQRLKAFFERHLMLPHEQWNNVFRAKSLRLMLLGGIVCCLLLASYNIFVNTDIIELTSPTIALLVVASSCLISVFYKWETYLHTTFIALIFSMNLTQIIGNNIVASVAPQNTGDYYVQFAVLLFFILNNVAFKPRVALTLNVLVLLTSIHIAYAWLSQQESAALLLTGNAGIYNMVVICIGGFITQHLTILVYQKTLGEVAAMQRQIDDMEASRLLVAENQRVKEELTRLNRISVVEAMATSIAHEMNQPIGSALSFAQASRRWLAHDPPDLEEVRFAISGVISQVERAGDIIRSIRQMIAQSPDDVQEKNALELIQSLLVLSRHDLQSRMVDVSIDPESRLDEIAIMARQEEIAQVVLNLINNAVEAFLPEQTDRRIQLRVVKNEERWVEIQVKDNGPGIAPEHMDRIFESFFTTKSGGTGLGLSICRKIAENHGGSLLIESTSGQGTTAILRLPSISMAPEHDEAEPY